MGTFATRSLPRPSGNPCSPLRGRILKLGRSNVGAVYSPESLIPIHGCPLSWERRLDSNQRPGAYEAPELPLQANRIAENARHSVQKTNGFGTAAPVEITGLESERYPIQSETVFGTAPFGRLRSPTASAFTDIVRTEQPQETVLAIRRIPSFLPHSKSTRPSIIERASIRGALFHFEVIIRPRHTLSGSPCCVTVIRIRIFSAPQPGLLRRPHEVSEVSHGSDAVHYMPRLNALRSGGILTLKPRCKAFPTVSQKNSRCESSASSGQSIPTARNEPWNSWAGDSITAFIGTFPGDCGSSPVSDRKPWLPAIVRKCSTYEV
jgi:hypothetical protein